jgi:hypothetical protein
MSTGTAYETALSGPGGAVFFCLSACEKADQPALQVIQKRTVAGTLPSAKAKGLSPKELRGQRA